MMAVGWIIIVFNYLMVLGTDHWHYYVGMFIGASLVALGYTLEKR